MSGDGQNLDRRKIWQPPARPEWLRKFNEVGGLFNGPAIVSLDPDALIAQATSNTGLTDFGDDRWQKPFRVLLDSVEREAKLTLFGRLLTRFDLLTYLEARLNITDYYKRHPEIDDQDVNEPIFIIGFGRSGTTILQEILSLDPQFRSVRHWESRMPCPPPEESTYTTDPRIAKCQRYIDLVCEASPPWKSMHAWGAEIPVEDPEITYSAFLSEVWPYVFQVPSYEKYFAEQDLSYYFWWHRRILKLLQWKLPKPHWLLKSPTSLPRIVELLKGYPDAKIIFTHRDPIASGDSVIGVQGTIYHWRTDDPYGGQVLDEWMLASARARLWDKVIDLIEDGTIRKGSFTNFLHHEFLTDPMGSISKAYDELGLQKSETAFAAMRAFLDSRPKGGYAAAHEYAKADEDTVAEERKTYSRYQTYFGIPDER
jgi:hypothetical protein